MTLILRNNGWVAPLNSPLSDFFESNEFLNNGKRTKEIVPAVNVFEDEEGYTIEIAAPGMSKEDFSVRIDEGVLTISAESSTDEEEGDGRYTHREYNYDSFSRSFTLPEDAVEDEIEANYEDGELILVIPKTTEVVSTAREIEIG